jgi:hypothetical protein
MDAFLLFVPQYSYSNSHYSGYLSAFLSCETEPQSSQALLALLFSVSTQCGILLRSMIQASSFEGLMTLTSIRLRQRGPRRMANSVIDQIALKQDRDWDF